MRIPARLAYLATFVGVCGHASSEFFAKLSGVQGPETSVWRYVLGSAALVVWALLTPGSRDLLAPLRTHGLRFVVLSLVGVSGAYLAFHWSLDFASVVQVATMTTTIPIFVGLANLIVNGQRIGTVKLVTGAMAVIGVVLLLTDGYLADLASAGGATLFGVALALACAVLAAGYSVLVKPVMAEHGALLVTTSSLVIGAIGLWVAVGVFWGVWVNPVELGEKPATAAWALVVLALWNTAITQVLWLGGLSAAPDITRASYLFFLKPVIAAVLALVFLSVAITPLQVAAILVVTGSVLVELAWPRLAARRAA